MTTLLWGVKASLLAYVRGMPDGVVRAETGAVETGEGFLFPGDADGSLRFGGRVVLTGHSGMMRVVLADPSLVRSTEGWSLEVADPDDPEVRLAFAAYPDRDGVPGPGGTLTAEGADLFFGPYVAGTPVDDVVLR